MADPIVPIIEPARGWRKWLISEIYTGPNGTGRYVPNIDDEVLDWNSGTFRVIDVNYTTGLSTLQKYIAPDEGGILDEDILLASGPGTQSESFRVFINTSVVPYRMAIHHHLRVYGNSASYLVLFRGTDISENGHVVSAMFDQNGELQSNMIPLQNVIMPDAVNKAVKAPLDGYVTEQMPDGEVVTAVIYSNAGDVLSYSKLIVKNTAFVRSMNAAAKYVAGITIESPFISSSDNRLIEMPINVPMSSLTLMGRVTYSDGSSIVLPIDNTKFKLAGINSFISTVPGVRAPLVLTYRLSPEEFGYNVVDQGNERYVIEDYQILTTKAVGHYSVKLFSYPTWVSQAEGYRLEHYLYSLDRSEAWNVTDIVNFGVNGDPWTPVAGTGEKTHVLTVDLDDISPIYAAYRHVQTIRVELLAAGNVDTDRWLVRYSMGGPRYGAGVKAAVQELSPNLWRINVKGAFETLEDWLEGMFYNIEPLIDPTSEITPPTPTHITIVSGDTRLTVPIAEWEQDHDMNVSTLSSGKLIFVEFTRQVDNETLKLGVAGLPITVVQS